MLPKLAKKFFGSANQRYVKKLEKDVEIINALESEFEALSDSDLQAKTNEFRDRLTQGEKLDNILHEAFATVREASKRTLGLRPFDVQLVGGIILHRGMVAEMKTGEGKTLVATMPVYLNALAGKGVHVVTVNDYLAKRDAQWMGQIYTFLGLSVGVIQHGLIDEERSEAYAADITYGTNNEFGFDCLRDNMKFELEAMVQRPFYYAIVDEVDSILIDEARTPLIISGPTEDSSELYIKVDKIIPRFVPEDYEIDEKSHSVTLTDKGNEHAEQEFKTLGLLHDGDLYDIENISLLHHVNQALRAHLLFERDKDYIVKDDKVVIIDEFTGRMMEGRRYSDGLHQAIEAKEKAKVEVENQTLASITFQNYFRLYPKLAGMTGTAMTEAHELQEIYKLEVVEIPTNLPCIRQDEHDEIYSSTDEKHKAIVKELKQAFAKGQPVLVGTTSIEKSEELSALFKKQKIKHNVLNARYHEQEAYIIAQAGQPGAVTLATNMAGRGTDIQLGGHFEMRLLKEKVPDIENEEKRQEKAKKIRKEIDEARQKVLNAGGLYVIGTERHESRRIDNQLRGRSGRQGDPGQSKFFVSLQDDLMRIFGSDRMDSMLRRLGWKEGEAIIHPWINKALERAQQKVEGRNFEVRKHVLKYDDVMNDQRKTVYEQRREIMNSESVHDIALNMRDEIIDELINRCIPEKAYYEQWDIKGLHEEILRLFALDLPIEDWVNEEGIADLEIKERLTEAVEKKAQEKAQLFGDKMMQSLEKHLLLRILDHHWKEHLHSLDHLRQGIGLRAYAQRDPLSEYKREAFELFAQFLRSFRDQYIATLYHIQLRQDEEPDTVKESLNKDRRQNQIIAHRGEDGTEAPQMNGSTPGVNPIEKRRSSSTKIDPNNPPPGWVLHSQLGYHIDPQDKETWGRVPRNTPCPCGSGKKYKQCHGAVNSPRAEA